MQCPFTISVFFCGFTCSCWCSWQWPFCCTLWFPVFLSQCFNTWNLALILSGILAAASIRESGTNRGSLVTSWYCWDRTWTPLLSKRSQLEVMETPLSVAEVEFYPEKYMWTLASKIFWVWYKANRKTRPYYSLDTCYLLGPFYSLEIP